jgi:small subunit ribosomal protein S6
VRFLTVKQDKFAHEYALKRRNKKSGKKNEAAGKTEKVEAEVNVNEKED